MRTVFLQILPKLLCMKRPNYQFANNSIFDPSINQFSDDSDYPIYTVNSINRLDHSKFKQSNKKKIKKSLLNGLKQTNKIFNIEQETFKRSSNKFDERLNERSKIQRKIRLSNNSTIRSIDNLQMQELNKSPLKIVKNLSNPINYSFHSIDESSDPNLSNKLHSFRNSISSIKTLTEPEEESSKNDDEDNDLNNSYLDNNQLGNQLDYRLDEGLDQIDNQIDLDKVEKIYRKTGYLKDYELDYELDLHQNQINNHLNGANRSMNKFTELINKRSEQLDKYSDKLTKQLNNQQHVKRQHSDSVISRSDHPCLKHSHQFNRSIDQILFNQTAHKQSKQNLIQNEGKPAFNKTSHQKQHPDNLTQINHLERPSIKQKQKNIDENIFLEALYKIERNPHIMRTMKNVYFLSEHTKKTIQEEEVRTFFSLLRQKAI